jgi:hypothetical protein
MFWDLFGLIVGIEEPTFFKGRFFFYAYFLSKVILKKIANTY